MIQVTDTQKEDFREVLALINHVYGKENSTVKMEDVFTDLLSENNMEHMRIIKADGRPVSDINYVINEIDINGCTIKAANIGAVCTHEDYRHRGYSTLILRDCLGKMRNEGVDFLYVSGDIGLYTGNNIHITGRMFEFDIDRSYSAEHGELPNGAYELMECSKEDIHLLYPFHAAEAVKFVRDQQRFCDLAARVPGVSVFNNVSKIFRIEEKGQIQGYFICGIFKKENGDFKVEVVEYAGNRRAVLAGIMEIMARMDPSNISGYVSWLDKDMLKALNDKKIGIKKCNYPGTVRIIDFTRFMQKLKPFYLQGSRPENIEFYEVDGKYVIRSGSMELVIKNDKTMHDLVLGNDMEPLKKEHITGDDALFHMLESILPISVPYPYNLNYI